MENLIFRLQGVVREKGEMQDFEGPLELILLLLKKNKVEIRDISVSLILEQYLQSLDKLAAMDLEIASEFVAMASHLVYIKTKTVLSGEEEIEELNDLINSLEELRRRGYFTQIKEMTDDLRAMFEVGSGYLPKPPETLTPTPDEPLELDVRALLAAMSTVLDKDGLEALSAPQTVAYPKRIVYSVTEKATEILTRIKKRGSAHMHELIADADSKSEMVAVFIAVLELCRSGVLLMIGTDSEMTLCASGADASIPDSLAELDEQAG